MNLDHFNPGDPLDSLLASCKSGICISNQPPPIYTGPLQFTIADVDTIEAIEANDCLLIDNISTSNALAGFIDQAEACSRFIGVTRTAAFGWQGNDKLPGFYPVLRDFVETNPEWFAVYTGPQRFGTIILSRDPQDLPASPVIAWPNADAKDPTFRNNGGAGTELKKLTKRLGFIPKANCDCNAKAYLMDLYGIAWCEANVDTIVGWMRENYAKRESVIPFIDMVAVGVVNLAIRNAKREARKRENAS